MRPEAGGSPRVLADSWSVSFGPGRVLCGPRTLERLGELVRELGARRVLLVSDPGVRGAGPVERAERALEREGLPHAVFDGVANNPTTRHVQDGLRAAEAFAPACLVGLGGGSSMDCA